MIYLDNAATTKPFKEHKFNIDNFFNPSSSYSNEINSLIFDTRNKIAEFLSAKVENVIFTSGGTEANNLAIRGLALKRESKFNIAYLGFEHKSVLCSIDFLEKKGYQTFKINYKLLENIPKLIEKLKEKNINLLVLSHLYSESGLLIDVENIVKNIRAEIGDIYIHIDAVQTFLKYNVNIDMGIDSISISAHKIHGFKGIGALILKNRNSIAPLILGGKQNHKLRGGTENILGIESLATVLKIWENNLVSFRNKLKELREYFDKEFDKKFTDNKKIFKIVNNSCHIVSLAIKDLYSAHIIEYLRKYDIYVSAGSACNDNSSYPAFLNFITIDDNYRQGIIRVSFSIFTKKEEIDIFLEKLKEAIDFLV